MNIFLNYTHFRPIIILTHVNIFLTFWTINLYRCHHQPFSPILMSILFSPILFYFFICIIVFSFKAFFTFLEKLLICYAELLTIFAIVFPHRNAWPATGRSTCDPFFPIPWASTRWFTVVLSYTRGFDPSSRSVASCIRCQQQLVAADYKAGARPAPCQGAGDGCGRDTAGLRAT